LKGAAKEQKTKGRLSKALDILLTLLIVASAGLVIYIMAASRGGRAVSIFGRSVLVVVTGSMEPSIHEGDYIIIKKCDPAELKAGDVITFVSKDEDVKGKLVTHRITAAAPDGGFVTKGDANETEDMYAVYGDEIVGKYTGRARFFEMISSFADPKKLLLLCGIVPLALVSLYEVRTLARLLKQSRQEDREQAQQEREKLIREEIEKEKQRLREQAQAEKNESEVKPDESREYNEA